MLSRVVTRPYALAVLFAVAAVIAVDAIDHVVPVPPFLLLLGAVALASRYGGREAAGIATFVCLVAVGTTAIPIDGVAGLPEPPLWIRIGVFAVVAYAIESGNETLRRARGAAEAQARDLADANSRLGEQMEEVQALSEHLVEVNEHLSAARDAAEAVTQRTIRLQQVTAALSKATTVEEVAHVLVTGGRATLHADSAALVEIDGDGLPRLVALSGVPAASAQQFRALSLDDDVPLASAMRTGQPVWLRSASETRRLRGVMGSCAQNDDQAFLAVPLMDHEQLRGGLAYGFCEPAAFADVDQAFVLLLATATTDALARAHAFDSERLARQTAEAAARAREDVLAVVAHDLRNPLNLVTMTTQLITDVDPPAENRRRLLDVMQRAAGRMNRLIGDLLDVARMDAGRFTLVTRNVPVRAILDSTLEMFEHAASDKGVSLSAELGQQDLYAHADPERVVQVLGNLVGNALKFVERGGSVRIRCQPRDTDVMFVVRDSGPGISPAQLERLFDRFWQARRDDRRGVGLGLTIARGIVEAHGGTIWVESSPGAGSTFMFTLPGAHATDLARAG